MSIDLNAPEVQDAIKAAVAEATAALAKKRDELLVEVKKARKNSEIDPEEFQRLKEENEALNDKLLETSKQVKNAMSESEKMKKALEAENGYVSRLLVDNGLNDALVKVGVKPEFTKAVKSMLEKQVQLKQDGENRLAVVGDKALADYVSEWSKSDDGKHFVAAPLNSGGGSTGGGNAKANTNQVSRTKFDAMSQSERASFAKEGGRVVDI